MIDSALRRARLAGQLAGALGPGWLLYRAKHAARLRSGLLERRLPAVGWDEVALSGELTDPALAEPDAYYAYRVGRAPAFLFAPADRERLAPVLRSWDTAAANPIRRADEVMIGVFRLFSRTSAELGASPDWHRNVLTGQGSTPDRHWSRIDDFGSGDIKVVWEPSRFAFTYGLVRAYWRTGDGSYAERFWELVESWRAANQPQRGANWKCGQETSLRVTAWCFGLYGLLDASATTPARVAMLAEMMALSGHRIEAMVDYALSQRNNHGVSEGMGLWTIGTLFPELRRAEAWRARGREILERLGEDLIYADGAFSQHSLNYHRLVLHAYLWSMRLGEVAGAPFSRVLYARVGAAADLLYQLQDEVTGRVPCYGANDGALIFPLSNADYSDYRPVVQAARILTSRARTFGAGPWDEETLWLFGEVPAATAEPPTRTDQRTTSGYVVLRSVDGFAFTRCGGFRHRPGHADLLHVDLWWRGINVALDAGTYSYNSPAPWDGGLAFTACHNTLTIDDRDQMDKVGRFLWLPWAHGMMREYAASPEGSVAYWEGEHDGYRRLPSPATHRRGLVRLGDAHWLVLDESRSAAPHEHRLHWLLADLPYEVHPEAPSRGGATVMLHTPEGDYAVSVGSLGGPGRFDAVRGAPDSTRGWRSPYYLTREPALSVSFDVRASTLRLWTLLGPAGARLTVGDDGVGVEAAGSLFCVRLGRTEAEPLVAAVKATGKVTGSLVIGR